MKGEMKQSVVCLCLLLFAALFISTFVVAAGNAATRPQCIASSAIEGLQDPGISCLEQCDAECEPGHWYSWLCRGFCVMGCSGVPPDFPGVSALKFHGLSS